MGLIEADAILASLRESRDRANVWLSDCLEYGSNMTERAEQTVMTFNKCILRVKGAPTVDAVPVVHGYWIKFGVSDKDGNQLYRCSVCKCEEIHSPLVKVNYCWNCGALMKWWEDGDHEQDKKS